MGGPREGGPDDPIGKTLEELNLSNEELKTFETAFKNPEFMKAFQEYAASVADPKAKEEADLYLRQLESEGRAEEMYGQGTELLVPEPGMVAKLYNNTTKQKLFINVCTSEKVEVAQGRRVDARRGMAWDIPNSLGPIKTGSDKQAKECSVVDFVIHPGTFQMAAKNERFRELVVDAAADQVEKVHSWKLDRSFSYPRLTYKATPGCERPHVLAIRGKGPAASQPASKQAPNKQDPAAAAVAAAGGPAHETVQDATLGGGTAKEGGIALLGTHQCGRSGFSFDRRRKEGPHAGAMRAQLPHEKGFVHATGEVTPEYEIVERGHVDLASTWADANRNLEVDTSHPKELVVRVTLPGVVSAASVQLDVSPKEVYLSVPGRFKLKAPLPFRVFETKGRAKFDRSRERLEVVLPVAPPTPPERQNKPAKEAQPQGGVAGQDGGRLHDGEEPAATLGSDAAAAAAEEAGAERGSGPVLQQSPGGAGALRESPGEPAAPQAAPEAVTGGMQVDAAGSLTWKDHEAQRLAPALSKPGAEVAACAHGLDQGLEAHTGGTSAVPATGNGAADAEAGNLRQTRDEHATIYEPQVSTAMRHTDAQHGTAGSGIATEAADEARGPAGLPDDDGLTANEREWRRLHMANDPRTAAKEVSGGGLQVEKENVEGHALGLALGSPKSPLLPAAANECGVVTVQQGKGRNTSSGVVMVGTLLKPRLSRAVADDID